MQTIYATYMSRSRRLLVLIYPDARAMDNKHMKYHEHLWWNDFPRYGKRFFKEHNDLVRSLVPLERLLEYEAKQGWGPLCEFLGKEVPEKEYPRTNDTKQFVQTVKRRNVMQYAEVLQGVAKGLLPVVTVAMVLWWRTGFVLPVHNK